MGWGTNEMGDQWNGWCVGAMLIGGPMRWGTNEMRDQWDGGPLSSNNCCKFYFTLYKRIGGHNCNGINM